MKTVHVIFNAHIDPIWLWPWQSGLDEVLATCRSACDRLDAHPDLTFTRGEAWVYDQVERLDPVLFERIRRHVESGQWEVTNGWWLQPDCNQPSGFALEHQIRLGKEYFESRFGSFPRIAYNVDSFGHAATLPALMRSFGQDRYVMMRPGRWEMTLPSSLFRWRGYDGGPEVVTFRIVESYNSGHDFDSDRILRAADEVPEGINDTMFFAGVGDHGGGPSERQIAWLRDHQHSFDGITLEMSSTARFFDAVWAKRDLLPVVTGELQMHAVGCYSVYRPIKTAVRKSEHLLRQAEIFQDAEPSACPPEAAAQINESWKRVCFNHFHDTLGGTCLPSAYAYPLAQLGYAQDVAETLLQEGLRRTLNALPDDPLQRIVLYNASDLPFAGPVEFTPWLDWLAWGDEWRLIDENDAPVPFQVIATEAIIGIGNLVNLLFPLEVPARGQRILRIQYTGGPTPPETPVVASPENLSVARRVSLTHSSLTFGAGPKLALPELMLYEDTSDTWSHDMDRYSDQPVASAVWDEWQTIDHGPLMASWLRAGTIGGSRLRQEWRVYSNGFAALKLTVGWQEQHKLLKLVQPLPDTPIRRTDGILGGWLERPFDGREMPLRDGMTIESMMTEGQSTLGIVAPDVYAADVTTERIRFTLLRSAVMAHHNPHNGEGPRRTFSDQGEHTFTFRYLSGSQVQPALLDEHAWQMQRPLVVAELTRGMPYRLFDRPAG